MNYPVEEIPQSAVLYYRIFKNEFRPDGKPKFKAFKEKGEGEKKGMSTNWDKHSTARQLLESYPEPEKIDIVSFIAGNLIDINLKVVHAPLDNNRSHTNVKGLPPIDPDGDEIRLKMFSLYTLEIRE